MEFVIPLEKNDLLQNRGREYSVAELISTRNITQVLSASKKSLDQDGPRFILKHFDEFFSVIVHGSKLELSITFRAFDRILRAIDILLDDMEKKGIPDEEKKDFLCINKMLAYLLSNLACYLEDKTLSTEPSSVGLGKKKKNVAKSDARYDWETRRDKVLYTIYRWLQLPLQNLWSPPIVEETFVMLFADICYKILENDKDNREKEGIKTIFQILGTLVKKYIHGITCTIRIVQLVKMFDVLAVPVANGVVSMITENGCTGFIAELAREIENSNLDEAEARNVAVFFETIATSKPNIVLGILENITDFLENDSHTMRNCAIGVLGTVIQGALTSENLSNDEKRIRDECFDRLEQHMLDSHAYVRSKVLQIWQKLCCESAIPISRYGMLVLAVTPHLTEKSATARKQTLILLRAILESSPFRTVLKKEAFISKRAETDKNMEELQKQIVAESSEGDNERFELFKALIPQIQKEIKMSLSEEGDDDDDDDDDKDSDDEDDDTILNADEEFEAIRQLLINKKVRESLKRLKLICRKLDWVDSMEDMSFDEQEHWYFFVLLKIFMESESDNKDDEARELRTAEWKKKREQIKNWKRVIDYLDNAIIFTTEVEKAMPIVQDMLYSDVPSVAVEACTLLQIASKYKIQGSAEGIQKALSQVFSREESVRNNVAVVYKNIYLTRGEQKTADGSIIPSSLVAVNGLIDLFKDLKDGQSVALDHLISIWRKNGDLSEEHIKIMWQKFTFKIPEATVVQSRCAIALLTMVASTDTGLMKSNMDNIIHIGFKTKGKTELLLARDSCRALKTIKSESSTERPIRFENDHEMFTEISTLLIDHFKTASNEAYASFASEAITIIYQLADQPDKIVEEIIRTIMENDSNNENSTSKLAKLLFLIGHISIRHMVYLDTYVYKELKRRNAIIEARKGKMKNQDFNDTLGVHASALKARRSIHQKAREKDSSFIEDNGEEALGGATADDADAEIIEEELENNIVNGDGFLAQFVPLILDVCGNPDKYNDKYVRTWGVLSLSKMMTVSSKFCQKNLQLLVTILEKSNDEEIRSNILFGLSDLMIRFPNEVEPWTSRMYARLRDQSVLVRKTAVSVLSNLVKREMIRVKGQMSEMAICIVDTDLQIRATSKQFFMELSHKGNVLYNIMPDIISKLTSDDANINEDDLHEILINVLGLLQKEKETDTLLDKICSRFQLAQTDRQWRDLAYCISLLQLGKKGVIKLIEYLPIFKNKIHLRDIQKALKDVLDAAKKKPNNKDVCLQLEEEIQKLVDKNYEEGEERNEEDRRVMPPPGRAPAKKGRKAKNQSRRRGKNDDDDDEDDDDHHDGSGNETPSTPVNKRRVRVPSSSARSTRKKGSRTVSNKNDGSSSNDESESTPVQKKRNDSRSTSRSRSARSKEIARDDSSSDDDENSTSSTRTHREAKRQTPKSTKENLKKKRGSRLDSSLSGSQSEAQSPPSKVIRSTRTKKSK